MKDGLMKTVVATALITALSVSALAFIVGPRIMKATSPTDGMNMQPALYNGPAQDDPNAQANANTQQYNDDSQPQVKRRPSAARSTSSRSTSSYSSNASYGEPTPVRHHRSTEKSVLIVAGSAGTGAAIGAIAGGGKGAGIGALAGGAAGLVYDRLTANK